MTISVESFKNPFSPKLFTEIFGDLLKNPPNICSPKIFAVNVFDIEYLKLFDERFTLQTYDKHN